MFELLQSHYPERLHALWFLNAPFIFWGVWRMVRLSLAYNCHKARQSHLLCACPAGRQGNCVCAGRICLSHEHACIQ